MQKKRTQGRGKRYYQDLSKAKDLIKASPLSVVLSVFEISPHTIALLKAASLSHRALVSANKEMSLYLTDERIKLPFKHCPYCTSTRVLLSYNEASNLNTAKCLTCKREIKYEETNNL